MMMFVCIQEFEYIGGKVMRGQVFIVKSMSWLECPVKDYYDFDDYWEEVKGVLK